jgi:hypothetical protein
MRLPRMTTRRWMMTVAFIAAIITAGRIGWRWSRFREAAAWHRTQSGLYAAVATRQSASVNEDAVTAAVKSGLSQIEDAKELWNSYATEGGRYSVIRLRTADEERVAKEALDQVTAELDAIFARHRQLADYHREMSRKYQRAAARPWLPIAPDPPVPE